MISFKEIRPTVFLRRQKTCLEQVVRLTLSNAGQSCRGRLTVADPTGCCRATLNVTLPRGETSFDVYIPEIKAPAQLSFIFAAAQGVSARRELVLAPPRRWKVHVVHLSHHDVGYTDLAARVKTQHVSWLDSVLELVRSTRHYPVEARFRIVVEQAWSIDH